METRRLSSRCTWWYKRGIPYTFFGFAALWTVATLTAMFVAATLEPCLLVAPILIAAVAFVMMKAMGHSVVDGVWDDHTHLVVRDRGKEVRVPLASVERVHCSQCLSPQRITLALREWSDLGNPIAFIPRGAWVYWAQHPLAAELRRRAAQARHQS